MKFGKYKLIVLMGLIGLAVPYLVYRSGVFGKDQSSMISCSSINTSAQDQSFYPRVAFGDSDDSRLVDRLVISVSEMHIREKLVRLTLIIEKPLVAVYSIEKSSEELRVKS